MKRTFITPTVSLMVSVLVVAATLLVTGCTGHVRGMKDVRWLSEEEKARVVEIALGTSEAVERLVEYGPEYTADLGWVAIVWDRDGQYSEWRSFEYDVVATGLPRGEQLITVPGSSEQIRVVGVPESADIYSRVVINFGETPKWQVYVAVNPDTGKVALVQENPFNTGPMLLPPEPTPALDPVPAPGISFSIEGDARLDKEAYLPGEDVVIKLSFENLTDEVFQLEPFLPPIEIIRRYPYDETAYTFPAGTEIRSLEPGEMVSYTLIWDQRDDQGQPVPYGHYYLEFGRVRHGDGWMTVGRHRYISLLILPEEGVMEKTINVNKSRIVSDITITLERVELTATETRFYAFSTPPDYDLPQGPNLPPPPLMSLHAEAEYSLDGGPPVKAGLSAIRFLENGMGHTWDMLDPVPKGAKELTFTVTKLGDWEGPGSSVYLLSREVNRGQC